jgi:hypothetical protein
MLVLKPFFTHVQLALTFGDFEDAFRNFSNASIRFLLLNKTPVFIGVAQWIEDISRVLNQRIRCACCLL